MSSFLCSLRLAAAAGLVLLLGAASLARAEGAAPSPPPTPAVSVIQGTVEAVPTPLAEKVACVVRVKAPAPATPVPSPVPADVLYNVVKDEVGAKLAAELMGQAVIVRGVVSTAADGKLSITLKEYEAVQPPATAPAAPPVAPPVAPPAEKPAK